MKIKTQFNIMLALFGLLLLLIAGSLAITNHRVGRLTEQRKLAENIERAAHELSYLSNDYLLHRQTIQRSRWETKFESLSGDLANFEPGTPEEQVLLDQIRTNHERLKSVFDMVAETLEDGPLNQDAAVELTFVRVAWSRMEIQNQGMVFTASLLAQQIQDQLDRLDQTILFLLFTLVSIFGAYFVVNYAFISRRILRSLDQLQAGTRIVGSGDLAFTLPDARGDEIGDLSRAFNRMINNLREITASKADLEREVAERMRAEEALRAYTERLQRSNQALQDFASIASHDLQEPLRKIQAFGEMLKKDCSEGLEGEGRDYIERMQGAAERMQNMIDGLLMYSRVTTQGQPFVEVDLQEIASEVLVDLEIRIMQTRGQVELGALPRITADPLQMRQLLLNLIGNALKYHHSGVPPQVKVSCRNENKNAFELWIEDNGIGFDMSKADQLFMPFHRLHSRLAYEGSGMGLAICQKIVERHGGSISAQSQPGQGSTFIVRLPRR